MEIYYPFTGETQSNYKIAISSNYGYRYIFGKRSFHKGIDFYPVINKNGNIEIIAPQSGILKCWVDQFGALVADINGRDNRRYRHLHLANFLRNEGLVNAGDVIGLMGSTGKSTGKHLHFEVWGDFSKPQSYINPNSLNLKYYKNPMAEREAKLKSAKLFNDKYLDIPTKFKLTPEGKKLGKLMNVIDTTKKEDALIIVMDFLNKMKEIGYTNTPEFDSLISKLAYIVNAKLDY